ncbi:ATP-binding cassette domain-containing protein [Lactobacillus delbrueckii subsp. lactis]|uniref:ATP-binding cassette domain-containing protein n=1 Tax=Lactobacillus delbrueckii TaxID=1584 RepID=UPI001E6270AA|nr:ATP-binding cassette domain-containing protein [Lactobacillus delbrueckii]MCD5430808.1 ATP-binding cassette domain-containing protein [Lactobacillus delbrueckii subsp. lactis]MCJ9698805.1 ATP-binding cassette domain-containing protein [Lactobacillus delbrueckii subsp. bulgaricus]MCD5432570.1 ATP-binding cassette domain-containing protein [Lactobacillus delbrueckii subsp. lactis]MCD5472375.1 ATP-binding cassette domain-containing protein [Lactobacillus delbrueckii subsp. lactis]MCO0823469.1 
MADRLAGSHQQGQPVLLQSTLLRLIAGLEAPTAGEITMNGQKLSSLNQQAQVMFQDDRLLPWETVLGNLLMTGNDPDKAKRLLARVGLEEYADAYPATLSGGQRQRAALTRVLLSSPQLLLLDTPSEPYQIQDTGAHPPGLQGRGHHHSARYPRRPGSHHHGQQDLGHQSAFSSLLNSPYRSSKVGYAFWVD